MTRSPSHDAQDDLSLKLLIVLTRAHRSVADRLKRDIQQYGLNMTEFAVLELLFHKGEQPIQHIGKKILLASGSTTYVVDQLEKKSLLKRKMCPNDRRVTYAVITEEGSKLMQEIFPRHRETIQSMFSCLSGEEKQTMIRLLKTMGIHAQGQ
ncbi:MarR family winged helix-turn-helix transcriptional regulator [Paenibacillus senegalensis]|uniref:MarR family winged helix-turn-helix transcriptional regulator n=1 Tax=Paenibacillus senegalensis TaxID=1465766 RepID=UPI000287DF57|nr:MarR family transcriptional regulator [Paenibacillus senegalensis]